MDTKAKDIDAYLASVPDDARATLEGLRQTIRALAPAAVESISYGMPTFKYQGKPLIYFAAAKDHCALYGTSAGTMGFQPGEPPADSLVKQLLEERIAAIEASAAGRKGKKPGGETSA